MKWTEKLLLCNRVKKCNDYTTPEAKLSYADSLMKIADKLFITPFVPFATASFIEQSETVFVSQIILSAILVWFAVCMRHEALEIIDRVHQNQLVS